MIAIDTNLLVYAYRADSAWYDKARSVVSALAGAADQWAIPWPCIHEFLAVVTHPRVYVPPSPLEHALEQVEAWLESPRLVLLAESDDYWSELRATLVQAKAHGPRTHDARIAALCRFHGVSELWSADRDFHRFTGIRVRNPLVS